MEESVKRRERLRALRLDSQSQSQTLTPLHHDNQQQQQQQLANPLVDYEQHEQHVQPRFDYYTDPLSAYSSSSHRHPSPSGSTTSNHHHPPLPYYPPPPPPPLHQGTAPTFNSTPYWPPRFHTPYPPAHHFSNFPPHTQPPTSGTGYSAARGRPHAHAHAHAHAHSPSHYYRSMLEDPWKFLTPVLWHPRTDHATFPNSWGSLKLTSITKLNQGLNQPPSSMTSIAAKKPRLSNSSHQSTTEPSLAQFLAAAAAAAEAQGDDSETL